MDIKAIAQRVIELNQAEDYATIYSELYSEDVVSIENWGAREVYEGMSALKVKGEQWEQNLVEMHESKVSEPLLADKSFALTFYMDVTLKDAGRMQLTELAVYRVNDEGKIYHEEFFG